MAFTELELQRIEDIVGALCRRIPPPHFRDRLRLVYEVEGHAVSLLEERLLPGDTNRWVRTGLARFRFFRSRGTWTLYWMRQDLKWHAYEPEPPHPDLAALVKVVEEDRYGAFWG